MKSGMYELFLHTTSCSLDMESKLPGCTRCTTLRRPRISPSVRSWQATWSTSPSYWTGPHLTKRKHGCCNAGKEGVALPLEKTGNNFKAQKDIEEIQKVLPHRFPFLLLDRVLELESQKYAVGYKNVTANDNFFTGHFPDRKIMPGVLQVEAMAQLGGIVMMDPNRDMSEQQNFFFGGIDSCKFRKPVVPGDTLMMKVELTKFNPRYGLAKVTGKAYVGEDLACEADMTLVLAK